MTTVICAKDKDKVIMATDSRATQGSYILTDKKDKIFKVDDKVLCAYSGTVCTGDYFNKHVTDIIRKNLYNISNCKDDFINLFFNDKIEQLLKEDKYVQFLVCDQDTILYVLPHCVIEIEDFLSIGSGSDYAMGAFTILYNKPYSNLEDIAIESIKTAAKFDKNSNDNIKVEFLARKLLEKTKE